MRTLEEIKQEIRDKIKVSIENPSYSGGQTCGVMPSKIILISEDLDLEIRVGYNRSQLKNRDLAIILFELTLDELIK